MKVLLLHTIVTEQPGGEDAVVRSEVSNLLRSHGVDVCERGSINESSRR